MWETEFEAGTTGAPMTYLFKEKQYVVVAIGGLNHPAEFVAFEPCRGTKWVDLTHQLPLVAEVVGGDGTERVAIGGNPVLQVVLDRAGQCAAAYGHQHNQDGNHLRRTATASVKGIAEHGFDLQQC